MGVPVLIMGESGSGKSTSLREFDIDEVGIFNVAGKPLPFKKKLNVADNATYQTIYKGLTEPKLKKYVIDDSQYLMAFAMFDKAKEVGFNKFTDIACDFRNLIHFIITKTPKDLIVYYMHHTEVTDMGKIKAKTTGKMIDSHLTLEGLFTIVLLAKTDGIKYCFETQSNGCTTCKSPIDMFETTEIDNDLKFVDTKIREYYELDQKEKGDK